VETHPDGRHLVYLPDRASWRAWLAEHHAESDGIWFVYYKQGTGHPTVSYDEAVEEALCFGWIDSRVNRIDDARYMQLFTPRQPGSTWSKVNKERIERLEAGGLITEAGWALIHAAKADGSWTLLDAVEELMEPEDLAAALDAAGAARATWDGFPASVKKPALYWVVSAKREATRAKRILQIVEKAAAGKRPMD
jgi:uncharacterized protein YdeI (YjbR/CyaY-like superfamily)